MQLSDGGYAWRRQGLRPQSAFSLQGWSLLDRRALADIDLQWLKYDWISSHARNPKTRELDAVALMAPGPKLVESLTAVIPSHIMQARADCSASKILDKVNLCLWSSGD